MPVLLAAAGETNPMTDDHGKKKCPKKHSGYVGRTEVEHSWRHWLESSTTHHCFDALGASR
jgi:hypothetical protein